MSWMLATGVLAFMLLFLASVRVEGRIARPGPLGVAYWGIMTVVPLVVLGQLHTITWSGLAYLWAGTAAFAYGSALASRRRLQPTPGLRVFDVSPLLRYWVAVGAIAGVLSVAWSMATYGVSLSALFSLTRLSVVSNTISISRYQDQVTTGQVGAVLSAAALSAIACGPFLTLTGRSSRLLRLIPIFTVALNAAVTTQRMPLLIGVSLMVSSYTAVWLLRGGPNYKITRGRIFQVGVATATTAGLFVGIALLRVGQVDLATLAVIAPRLSIYAFGATPAFSQWMESGMYSPLGDRLAYGAGSLPGVHWLTGIDREATRSYDHFTAIGAADLSTNIYTAYRILILDYGEAGALVVLVLWALAMSVSLDRMTYECRPAAAGWFVCLMSTFLLSNTYMITTFTNVFGALVVTIVAIAATVRARSPEPTETLSLNSGVGRASGKLGTPPSGGCV